MVLKKEITFQIKDLLQKNPQGLSITDIVKEIKINRNTAGRYLENLLVSGQVDMRRFGMAKIYILSQRVPLSAVLSISSELVIQLDSSLRIIFANEPFLKLIGTEFKNLMRKNIEYTAVTLVFDDAFTGFIENIRQGITGREWSGEIALSTKDIILFCRIAPTVFEDGSKGVSVILEDITQRKRAERALLDSEDRYRKLIEISPDAILLHIEGKITYLNQAALHMLGAKDSNEILGKNVLDLIHPDFRHTVKKNIEKDLNGEITPPTELNMIRLDGTTIVAEGRGVKTTFNGKPAIQVAIRDTTERKRVEMELRESEEKYRTLVNRANDVICVIQDGVIKICNPRLPELWGRSDEDITGRPFTDFVHPDALSELIDIYKRRISGESAPSIYETTLMHKDGSKSFVEVNAGVIVYEGRPADLVIVRNINDRKKAEDTLRESEATARALMNAPTDSVILTDSQGIILAINETAASRFGRRPEELVGILADDLLPKEVAQSRRFLVSKMLETKTMVRFEDEREGRWYDTVAYPIVSENGKVTKIAIISRDITDRKNTEEALIKSEERYRQLVDISPDAILLQREGKIVFTNPAALNLLGASYSSEIIGKNVLEFIQPEFHDTIMKTVEKDIGGEITLPIELHMHRIDGTSVIVEGRGARTFIDGKPAIQIALRERYCARVGRNSTQRQE